MKVTTRALKTIKKYGGLDDYVLNTRHELLGYEGMRIRMMVRGKMEADAKAAKAGRRVAAQTSPKSSIVVDSSNAAQSTT